jgi:uncharacterized membrane protein YccC
VLVFAAVAPRAHLSQLSLVFCLLAFSWGAEALMGRNYWLGSVCVTPIALLITEFAHVQQPAQLITQRIVDTFIGALVGIIAAFVVTNRRAADRIEQALAATDRAREHAERTLAAADADPGAVHAARRVLVAAVVGLRSAVDAAAGEWWQRALPMEPVVAAHRSAAPEAAAAEQAEARPGTGSLHDRDLSVGVLSGPRSENPPLGSKDRRPATPLRRVQDDQTTETLIERRSDQTVKNKLSRPIPWLCGRR